MGFNRTQRSPKWCHRGWEERQQRASESSGSFVPSSVAPNLGERLSVQLSALAVLVSHVTDSDHPLRSHPDQEFAFYGVANSILLRSLLTHVSTGDHGRPPQ